MADKLGPVLVCKEFSDSYNEALSNHGFQPYFLQVLDTSFVNEEQLQEIISEGPDRKYDAVVVTSSRAAEAWVNATNSLQQKQGIDSASWNNTLFYVVGKATAKALQTVPAERIMGAESGNGEALAQFIVSHHKKLHPIEDEDIRKPFLLLTGDKNRETIPEILTEGGFSHRKQQVYGTVAVSDLDSKLENLALKMKQGQENDNPKPWVIFFSPSTADHVINATTPTTGIRDEEPSRTILSAFRIATIGPTTATHLQNLGYDVVVSSPKPDPVVLAESLGTAST